MTQRSYVVGPRSHHSLVPEPGPEVMSLALYLVVKFVHRRLLTKHGLIEENVGSTLNSAAPNTVITKHPSVVFDYLHELLCFER